MKVFALILIAGILGVSSLISAETEPIPEAMVKYKDGEVPLYDSTQLHPITTVKPVYPTQERRKGVQGTAIIMAVVDTDGKVVGVKVNESKPTSSFGEAGKACVSQWHYAKLIRDGKPSAFIVRVHLSFSINQR